MADPQHVEILDGFDRLTVTLYRSALGFVSGSLLLQAAGVLGPLWGWAHAETVLAL